MSCVECGVFFVEDTLCCALLGIECDDGIDHPLLIPTILPFSYTPIPVPPLLLFTACFANLIIPFFVIPTHVGEEYYRWRDSNDLVASSAE